MSAQRVAAVSALAGGVFAFATVVLFVQATGGDFGLVLRPEKFLSLPVTSHKAFYWAMVLDCLGFYLPFLFFGVYLWHSLRESHGVLVDMALACLLLYVVFGVAGASLQFATLFPIRAWYLGNGGAEAAGAAWLAVSYGAQHGLWIMEGPVMAFAAGVLGAAMRMAGMPAGRLLQFIGLCYGLAFIACILHIEFVLQLAQLSFITLLPLWMLITGWHLWHRAAS